MPRLSARQRSLRETRGALLHAFLENRAAIWEQEDNIGQSNVASSSSSIDLDTVNSLDSSSSSDTDLDSLDFMSISSSSSIGSSMSVESSSTSDEYEVVQGIMRQLESRRVLHERRTPRGMERLVDRLRRLKASDTMGDAAFYRHLVRMTPDTFDAIVEVISVHNSFVVSDPRRPGASPEEQAAVAFYRLGRSGNGGGVVDVSFVCGCAEGSVIKYTAAICKALYDMRDQVLCWASGEEKEVAKAWVAEKSGCVEFSGGYSMVDGSLIPLAFQPGKNAFSREYWDRKGQYSLNIQLVVLPVTLRTVDYVVGYKGSTQDSRAFAASDIVKRPGVYLEEGEFVWTDGGYGLSDFTCGPYDHVVGSRSRDFRRFNRAVSNVRVRSEHGFGYLKGRFQCLRGLRLYVRDEDDHERLTTTIVAALVAHNLALRWDGSEERRVFLDFTTLSRRAARAWDRLQRSSPERDEVERMAWTRRVQSYQAKVAADSVRNKDKSQHQLDTERKQGGKQLREQLHQALFAARDWEFEDTTEQSRLHDRTEQEYQDWLAEKAARAAARRGQRQQARREGR